MNATLTIPDKLDELTLRQYKHFLTVTKDLEGEFYNQRMIESLCNVSFLRARMIKKRDVNDIIDHLTTLLSSEKEFSHRFFIKNVEFGMIPDLENITSGEYADLTKYIGDEQTMNKAMAVLFRPIKQKVGEKYSIIDYNGTGETSELLNFMPLGVAMGAVVFFYRLTNDLTNAIHHSTMSEAVKEILQSQPNLGKNGDGISTFIPSLKAVLQNLTRLPN